MSWLEKIIPSISNSGAKKNIPEGLWSKCPSCDATLYKEALVANNFVCPQCNHHQRIGARVRIDLLLDKDGREEIAENLQATDPLEFKDSVKYKDRYAKAQKTTGEKDALVVSSGKMNGMAVVVAAFEFKFMGGSMGSVVGEKFTRGAKLALEKGIPFICVSASGGARMQEGLFSLMQMSKTSLMVKLLSDKKIPFISVLQILQWVELVHLLQLLVMLLSLNLTHLLALQGRELWSKLCVKNCQKVFNAVSFC
jgi:acetyl-CoA carboxylase carboxyl transferase subunit beta